MKLLNITLLIVQRVFEFFGGISQYIARTIASLRFIKLIYKPIPTDVFIVTYPRSCTTWMQMIIYQLISNGDLEFNHIGEKIPFFERIPFSNIRLKGLPNPRIFKTHLPYDKIPKGKCKYIYIMRNGMDVVLSYYHFYKSYLKYHNNFDAFFKKFLDGKLQSKSWFNHVLGWYKVKENENVLFLHYEDLKNNFDATIVKISNFLGIELNKDKLKIVKQNSEFDFMKNYEEKFDHANEILLTMGIKPKNFLRKGTSDYGKIEFDDKKIQLFEKKMDEIFKSKTIAKI